MLSDKELKKQFRKKASSNPEKYYATEYLKEKGYMRKKCNSCGLYFWTTNNKREVCGDANCQGGLNLKDFNVDKMTYIDVWKNFSKKFDKLGYKSIPRYPVVSRWNPTTDFTMASIAAFQPYVVSGEVKPPAKELTIPQFSLRFNDIDNVGRTGSHMTGFVMIGQHAFVPEKEWDQERYFSDINKWLNNGIGLNKDEIVFHEDVWAGGGNFGPCMEYFAGGVELGNQVYMQFEQTNTGYNKLNQMVLDMGMGQERNAWFTQPNKNSYETTFPTVVDHVFTKTGINRNTDIMKKFKPYASYLNDDETDNLDKEWEKISNKIDIDKDKLKTTVSKNSALYAISDHTRSLLVAINDGALPSNVGGGYNLRIILRRTLDFINEYDYNIDIHKLFELHAESLKPQYPELSENLESVQEIIKEEVSKYKKTRKKTKKKVEKITKKKNEFNFKDLKKLYQSNGITPEDIKKYSKDVKLQEEGFYSKLSNKDSSKSSKKSHKHSYLKNFDGFEKIPKTKKLYFNDYTKTEFSAKIINSFIHDKKTYIVLDKSYFYPTSGGQQSDKGYIIYNNDKIKINSVIKFNEIVFHVSDSVHKLDNNKIKGVINEKRRNQLTKHHTGAHIINYASHKYLGKHVWQAGAHKTVKKGRLDITHYKSLSLLDELEIERIANDLIKKDVKIDTFFEDKDKAEKNYGMRVYQGGAIPGSKLRIVKISDYDIEACGGTHLNRTSEADSIRIINSTRIQDGVVRIEYVAGKRANDIDVENKKIFDKLNKIAQNNNSKISNYNTLENLNYLIKKSTKLLNISRKKLAEKIVEFTTEINENKSKLEFLEDEYNLEVNYPSLNKDISIYQFVKEIFNLWKKYNSILENNEEKVISEIDIKYGKVNLSVNSLRKVAEKYFDDNFLIYNSDGFFVVNDNNLEEKLKENKVGFGGRSYKQGKADINLLSKLINTSN